MSNDVYENLAIFLNDLPAGFPRSESGVELRILRHLFTPEEAGLAVHLALIAGSYLLANLTASVYTTARKGMKFASLLPFSFAILHVSYGFGFLVGLAKFSDRWGDKIGKVLNIVSDHA